MLSKLLAAFDFYKEQTKSAQLICTVAISMAPGTSAPCQIAATTVKTVNVILEFIGRQAMDISQRIYDEVVGGKNSAYAGERQESIYENAIANHGNIITTFYATQQLKVMLGEISDGIAEEREDENRRLAVDDCDEISPPYRFPCNKVSCADPTRYCDGGFNYPYIAFLKGGEFTSKITDCCFA